MKIFFSLLCLLVVSTNWCSATVMSDLAVQLQPGTWAELQTNGFNNGVLLETKTSGKSILQYAEKAVWSPNTRQFMFMGAPHYEPHKFVIYSDTNNAWTTGPLAASCQATDSECVSHSYDHNTINAATGEMYFRLVDSRQVYRYPPNGSAWVRLPDIPMSAVQCCGALEWFPERNELVFFDGDWGIWAYSPPTNQWKQLAETNGSSGTGLPKFPMAEYSNVSHYNPVHKVILFGGSSGGTNYLYKYASNGTFTRLNDAPINVSITQTIITVDPVSGKYLVLGDGNRFFEYDISTDIWTEKNSTLVPPIWRNGDVFDTIATPISTYGVIMFVKYYFDQSKVYLYKHAPSTPDTQKPTTPTNLTATAVSSSQVNLAWTAAIDNIGVTGYRVYRNGTQINTATTTSYVDTGLQASTTYTYTLAAYDATGNQSSQSASVSVTTSAPDTTPPTVVISAPTSGAIVSNVVTVSATATDNISVTGVQFKLDGVNLGAESAIAPYSVSWNTKTTTNGTHTLTAVARDAAGNTKTSTAISVSVNNVADTMAPTTPANLAATAVSSSQINLTWTASTDNVGVTGYKVYRSGSQVGTATSTSYSDSDLTAQTSYSYTVQAYDAVGNNSAQSAAASATTLSGGSQPADFAARCSAPGVLKCVSFDNASDIAGRWGNVSGIFPDRVTPILDTAVKASGASSLKFTIPSNSGSGDSGAYFTNFSDDLLTLFGEGEEFYVQWRQRFSSEFLTTNYTGGGGWKQIILGEGDRAGVCNPANPTTATCPASCTQLEIVAQNTSQLGIPQMYHSCGEKDDGYEPLEYWDNNLGNIVVQNAVGCLYGSGYLEPPCVRYKPNQWMTFQIHVKIGTWYKNDRNYHRNSTIRMWVADERQPSKLVTDFSPGSGHGYDIANTDTTAPLAEYGKLWLLPYHTDKDSSQSHPTAYTWYDELIISRNKIADPSGISTPLAAPTNLVIIGN